MKNYNISHDRFYFHGVHHHEHYITNKRVDVQSRHVHIHVHNHYHFPDASTVGTYEVDIAKIQSEAEAIAERIAASEDVKRWRSGECGEEGDGASLEVAAKRQRTG